MNLRLKKSKVVLFLVMLLFLTTGLGLMTVKAETKVISKSEARVVAGTSNDKLNDFISVLSFTPISETECDV